MSTLSKRIVMGGVDESDEIGLLPHKSALQLHLEAARNALRDAGLKKTDVDAVFSAGVPTTLTAEYLGIAPQYTDNTSLGGSSFLMHVEHAAAAIAAGLCQVALITHGQTGHSDRRRGWRAPVDPYWPSSQFEAPYGIGGPPWSYALACHRHMYEYGTTHEQLAEIAVATRKWAQINPKALMRDTLTIGDVLASEWICYPFHILDCCLVTDAGGAVVLTSAERARDGAKPPVYLLGSGAAHTHHMISQMPSLTSMAAMESGKRAFAMAGLTPQDIDVAVIYDSFTYTVLLSLEDLGFCPKGEGGAFVQGQRTAPGGDFPLNTNGGGLSYTHPGMYGIFAIIEAVRQLRGECGERQVRGAKVALAHGTGGVLSSGATLILGRD